MHIFYAVHNHYWEDQNLLQGLLQAGHKVSRAQATHPFHDALGPDWTTRDRLKASERLVQEVKRAHARERIDVLFAYLINQLVLPEAVREISAMGIVTMNYWCNGAHQFHLVNEISPAFDFCIATERMALPAYQAAGANPVYLQMAANPEIYRPMDVRRDLDVTFVGQRYADRPEYIDYLLRNGVDVQVWGPGWTRDRRYGEKTVGIGISRRYLFRHPRASVLKITDHLRRRMRQLRAVPPSAELRLGRIAGPSLPLDELVKTYSRSKISLGFSTTGNALYEDKVKVRQIHLRDFEAPMSGAMYFTEHQEELAEFYEIGKEVVTYSSREELLERVRFFLSNPTAAQHVREAGYARAQRDHTWTRRFATLFDQTCPHRL